MSVPARRTANASPCARSVALNTSRHGVKLKRARLASIHAFRKAFSLGPPFSSHPFRKMPAERYHDVPDPLRFFGWRRCDGKSLRICARASLVCARDRCSWRATAHCSFRQVDTQSPPGSRSAGASPRSAKNSTARRPSQSANVRSGTSDTSAISESKDGAGRKGSAMPTYRADQ